MTWTLFLQLVGTLAVAIAGGWLGHSLAATRDLTNERRKLRVTYLLEAYRRLESASNRDDIKNVTGNFESAIADIQLLGSREQVELARSFAKEMSDHGTSTLDTPMQDLRQSLRAELDLEPVQATIIYMRLTSGSSTRNQH